MLVNAAFASDLLKKKEGADVRYIQRMERYADQGKDAVLSAEVKSAPLESGNILDIIKKDVLNGSKRTIVKNTESGLVFPGAVYVRTQTSPSAYHLFEDGRIIHLFVYHNQPACLTVNTGGK